MTSPLTEIYSHVGRGIIAFSNIENHIRSIVHEWLAPDELVWTHLMLPLGMQDLDRLGRMAVLALRDEGMERIDEDDVNALFNRIRDVQKDENTLAHGVFVIDADNVRALKLQRFNRAGKPHAIDVSNPTELREIADEAERLANEVASWWRGLVWRRMLERGEVTEPGANPPSE